MAGSSAQVGLVVEQLLCLLSIAGLLPEDQVEANFDDSVEGVVDDLLAQGLLARSPAGLHLTGSGTEVADGLFRRVREDPAMHDRLERAYQRFEPINERFLQVMTDWQLDGGASGLPLVIDCGRALRRLLTALNRDLPRFGWHEQRLSAALRKAREGDAGWVTDPFRPSCHTVWHQCHEDWLRCLGRDRAVGG